MNNAIYDVLNTMEKLGGGFVKQLAKCFLMADEINRRRLLVAFPEYFDQYDDLTTRRKISVAEPSREA